MILKPTPLADVTLLEPELLADDRGCFARTFDAAVLERAGLVCSFAEHSIAHNVTAGTVRGMHFQAGPVPEAKIVRCTRGSIYDVAVDLRRTSPTFGRWFAAELTDRNRSALYVPPGCAHGYQTLCDDTEVLYLISAPYSADLARGVHHADPQLAIPWPLPVGRISARDRSLPFLAGAGLS